MSTLKKSITNTLWLFSEKILTMVSAIAVSVILARYLGTQGFGKLNYLISLMSIIAPFSALGLNAIVTRELVNNKDCEGEILGTSTFLRLLGAFSAICITLLVVMFYDFVLSPFWVVFAAIANIFTSFFVIDYYFQSKTRSKNIVRCRLSILLFSSSIKVCLVYYEMPINYFFLVILIEPLLLAISFWISYLIYSKNINKSSLNWSINYSYAKKLLGQSKWLILSSFMAVIYLKIDQLMLGQMIGVEAVAIYAVSARLSEVWYFFPIALVSSFFPRLLEARFNNLKYEKQMQQLCDILFISALLLAIFVQFVADELIVRLYGMDYIDSSTILKIHIWSSLFIFMRALLSKWLIAENLLKYSLLTHAIAAVINVTLNLYLIPLYLGVGAAVATLVSYAFSSYIVLWFSSSTRGMALIMTRSIFFVSLFRLIRRFLR